MELGTKQKQIGLGTKKNKTDRTWNKKQNKIATTWNWNKIQKSGLETKIARTWKKNQNK